MPQKLLLILIVAFCSLVAVESTDKLDSLAAKRANHQPIFIEDHHLTLLTTGSSPKQFNDTLANILIPRVVGSPGHAKVRKYIKDTMASLKWTVDTDPFEAATPNLGTLSFENIIATLNPKAKRFLVLACHFDSKYFPNDVFLGASDSAVPCTMLIDLATVMAPYLEQNRDDDELSLQLLFLDGEEAFKEWSKTDSLYGARHLAARWEREDVLKKIDLFVLLDLLGMPDPTFYSFFAETAKWHSHLIDIESRLAGFDLLPQHENSGITKQYGKGFFQEQAIRAGIEDDHVPFLERGVPILHVIPLPFPNEWHTMEDDWRAVDLTTTENLNRMFRIFVAEYLHLNLNI